MNDDRRVDWTFGPFRLLPAVRRLELDGHAVRVGGRAFDLLTILVRHAGDVVPARRLLDEVWQDLSVDDSSLRVHIRMLRKALNDHHPHAGEYIANVPGRGYSFVAQVQQSGGAPVAAAGADPWSGLPARAGRIIGRADTIAAIRRELSRNRLVTVAGPAGVGKTTVATAIAQAIGEDDAGSVRFVDLAPVGADSLVISTFATVLGIALREVDPLQDILQKLRTRPLLVVLDNCEHVIDAVAKLAERLLRETSQLRLLITSREPLRLEGERVHRLMPLSCPTVSEGISLDEAMSYPAVQLFAERAAAGGGPSLGAKDAPAAAEICRRLDGIPLAIELAAARAELFGVEGLAQRLNDLFAVLTQGRRFALARHQTLRATLDWGYTLLSSVEQATLRRLSVFRSTFTLEAALAIIGGPSMPYDEAIQVLANLVAKSLLATTDGREGVRYRLLEATRLHVSEKLAESEEARDARLRHAEHHYASCLSLAR